VAGRHSARGASRVHRRRAKGQHRVRTSGIEPYKWLGTGAVTLGLGAALMNGAGIAHADSGAGSGSTGESSSASADVTSSNPNSSSPNHETGSSSTSGSSDPTTLSASSNGAGTATYSTSSTSKDVANESGGTHQVDRNAASSDKTRPGLKHRSSANVISKPAWSTAPNRGTAPTAHVTEVGGPDSQTGARSKSTAVSETIATTISDVAPSAIEDAKVRTAEVTAAPSLSGLAQPKQPATSVVSELLGLAFVDAQPHAPQEPFIPTAISNLLVAAFKPKDEEFQAVSAATSATASPQSVSGAAPVGVDPSEIVLSPDGKRIYGIDPTTNNLVILNSGSLQPAANPVHLGNAPGGLVVAPDGNHVYVGNTADGTVSVIDTRNWQSTTVSVGTNSQPIAVTSDNSRVFVLTRDSAHDVYKVSVFDAGLHAVRSPIPIGPVALYYGSPVAVSPDGRQLYVATLSQSQNQPGTIKVINTGTGATQRSIPVGPSPTAVTISRDGKRLYVIDGDNTVRIIDTTSGKTVGKPIVVSNGALSSPVLNPDGARLYVTDFELHKVYAINTKTGAKVATYNVTPNWVAVSRDGAKLYLAYNDSVQTISTGYKPTTNPPSLQAGLPQIIATINALAGDYLSLTNHLRGAAFSAGVGIAGSLVDLGNQLPAIAKGDLGAYFRGLGDVASITLAVSGFVFTAPEATVLIASTDALLTLVNTFF